jgi:hypothetical protein
MQKDILMNTYYITLVRELSGYCIKVVAPSIASAIEYAYLNYGNLWCNVYDSEPLETCIGTTKYLDE